MVNIVLFVRPTKKSQITKVGFRLIDGRDVNVFYTSDILVDARLWDQKRQTFKSNVKLLSESDRIHTLNEITRIKELILFAYNNREPNIKVTSKWLKSELDYLQKNPEELKGEPEKTFFESFEHFISTHKITEHRKENYRVLLRSLQRYEKFKQLKNRKFKLSFQTLNSDMLRDIEDYLRNEHQYYIDYPELFKLFPDKQKQRRRGDNTIAGLFSKIRTFTKWAIKRHKTITDPFNDYIPVKEEYGTPFYLTIKERNQIYKHDFSSKPNLELQRDIFIFQCMVGCRIGDLYKFTKKSIDLQTYIENGETKEIGMIGYIAGKTKKGDPKTINVPLTNISLNIYKKYKNVGGEKLFPFISMQKYNDTLKVIFKEAGIDRLVTVLNPTTNDVERKHLYEVASSHIARRTFIGNMYKKIGDQRLVSSMSGHIPNSKAFGRYAEVDEEMKINAIRKIDLE